MAMKSDLTKQKTGLLNDPLEDSDRESLARRRLMGSNPHFARFYKLSSIFSKIWKRYEISYLLEVFWAELFKNNVQETKTPAERAKILPKTDKNAASSDLEA